MLITMDYLHHIYAGRCAHSLARRGQSPERTILLFGVRSAGPRGPGTGRGLMVTRARPRPTLHPGLDSAMTRRRELGGCVDPPVTLSSRKSGCSRGVSCDASTGWPRLLPQFGTASAAFRKRAFPQHTACRHKPAGPVCFCKRCINVKDRPEPLFEAHNGMRDHSRCGSAIRSPVCAHFFR